ncbi:hypothetical protein WMF45_15325 [Sorangium sp. So ce448]|uniref:hypothetical protein n=1 Tax=Sorangium sp. So ce448 TaxID=3133314 RepID=UPI003F5DB977
MSTSRQLGHAYNQTHTPRKYAPGRRRFSVYISWTYPGEANRDVTELDNRFSTMTDVRRVAWPTYETPQYSDPLRFQQGIAATLELFFLSWTRFQEAIGETTGYPVPMYQRTDQAGRALPLDERVLADTDTLLVWGLDHNVTQQEAAPEEIESVRQFLARDGTCLILGPHHDIGDSADLKVRAMEHIHHGDPLVPHQERFGGYVRSLMRGLGIPIENRWGLRPAVVRGTRETAPLATIMDLDTRGWLDKVTRFNLHPHLPHYALTTEDTKNIHVLARQPIDMSHPHPFTLAGNTEFNRIVWMPPDGDRAGDVLLADSTLFSTLFGVEGDLDTFWKNLALR